MVNKSTFNNYILIWQRVSYTTTLSSTVLSFSIQLLKDISNIDSASSVNVVSAGTFYNLNDQPRLSKDKTKIYAYNSKQELPLLGFCGSKVRYGKIKIAKIFIVKWHSTPLLSYETAVKLDIQHITFSAEMTETKIVKGKAPELLQGTGKLKVIKFICLWTPHWYHFYRPH